MSANISLSSYTLRALDNSTEEYVGLNEINENEDMLDILKSFLAFYLNHISDEDEIQKLFQISEYGHRQDIEIGSISYRMVSGIVKTGRYGYESEIFNKDNNTVSYHRKKEDAELLPFYFLVGIPSNKNEGIVILQSFMQFGIKKVFEDTFGKYFKSKNSEYNIEINNLVPEELLQKLLTMGTVTTINYIRFEQPVDLADAADKEDHKEKKVQAEIVISKNNDLLSGMIHALNGKLPYKKGMNDDPLKDLIEITSPNFEYDDIKIKVRLNKKYRTIDLYDFNNLRPTIDISDDVKTLSSGHPEFDSINQIAIDLFKDLATNLGIER